MRENPLERNANPNFQKKTNKTWKYNIVIKVHLQKIDWVDMIS